MFQHSLMNLGVETDNPLVKYPEDTTVSAFSDESWGGDPTYLLLDNTRRRCFSIL